MKIKEWKMIENTMYNLDDQDETMFIDRIIKQCKSNGTAKRLSIINSKDNTIRAAVTSFNDKSRDFQIIIEQLGTTEESYRFVRNKENLNLTPKVYIVKNLIEPAIIDGVVTDLDLESCYSKEDMEFKFITVRTDKEIILIVGPEWKFTELDQTYKHYQIRESVDLNQDYTKTSGGGMLNLSLNDRTKSEFVINFGGESSDYGVYDPLLLAQRWDFEDLLLKDVKEKVLFTYSWND